MTTAFNEWEALMAAEATFKRMARLELAFSDSKAGEAQVSERYGILHHPYTSLAKDAGSVLQTHVLRPALYARYVTMVMDKGGTVKFDESGGLNSISYLPEITDLLPPTYVGKISAEALESRVLEHVSECVPIVLDAFKLPDGDQQVGLSHEELRDLSAYLQAFRLAKTSPNGLDAVRLHIEELKKGEVLPGQVYA